MKRVLAASNSGKYTSIVDLSEEELQNLPEKVALMTRFPGPSKTIFVFQVVSKDEIIQNPDKCFYIDSYWHYAFPRDVYLATEEEIREKYESDIKKLENQMNRLLQSRAI